MNLRRKTKSIMSINSSLKAAQKFSDCRRVMIIKTKIRRLGRIFFLQHTFTKWLWIAVHICLTYKSDCDTLFYSIILEISENVYISFYLALLEF